MLNRGPKYSFSKTETSSKDNHLGTGRSRWLLAALDRGAGGATGGSGGLANSTSQTTSVYSGL